MADIIERSLELSVVGVDEASDVFATIADQVDDLQERFQTAFDGMTAYAEDSASTIADAANSWAPVWISQLEALETAAAGTFSAVTEIVDSAASEVSSAGATAAAGWESSLGSLDGIAADAFGGVSGEADAAAGDISASGETAVAGWQAALDGLDGIAAEQFDAVAGEAEAAASEAGAASDVVESAWLGSLEKIGEEAVTTAEDVIASFDSIEAETPASADAVAAAWTGGFDKITGDGAATAEAVSGSMDSIVANGAEKADGLAADWAAADTKIAEDATAAGEDIDAAFRSVPGNNEALADAFVAGWSGAFDKVTADAAAAAEKVDASLAGIDTAGAASVEGLEAEFGAGSAATGATGEKAAAGSATEDEAAGGFSLGSLSSNALLTLIGGSASLAGVSTSISSIQQIGNLAAETGESPAQADILSLAARAQGSGTNVERLIGMLDTNIQNIETKEGTVPEADYVNLGSGKAGTNPATLKLVQEGGQTGAAAALELLFGSSTAAATELGGMQGSTAELAVIAEKMDSLNLSAQEQTAIVKDLFGRSGVAALPLMEQYPGDIAKATAAVDAGGKSSLGSQLNSALDPSGQSSMANYEIELGAAETKLELAFTELTPVMTDLVKVVGGLVTAIEHPLRGSNAETLAEDTGVVLTALLGKKAAGALLGKAGDALGGAADAAAGAAGDLGGTAVDVALGTGSKLLGPAGLAAAFLMSPGDINPHAETAYGPSAPGVDQGYTPAQIASMRADQAAAERYGLNATALIASQTNESDFLADRYQDSPFSDPTKATPGAPGRGLAQFSPATWEADYRSTYGKAPTSDNAATYSASVQANVEAHTLKASGLDLAGTSNEKGLTQIVSGFEHPASNTPDIAAGTSTIEQFTASVKKGMADSKAAVDQTAPELPKDIATSLNTLVDDADKYGSQFSSKVKTHMTETRSYVEETKPELTTAGKDAMEGLLQGVESEEGPLTAEAQKIATGIENTIRAALDSHSPSEAMARVGEDIIAGLTLGIERTAHEPALAVTHAATNVIGAPGGGSPAGGSGGQPLVVQLQVDKQIIGQIACEYINGQMKLIGNIPARN